jgi:hypothetical protein
MERVMALLEAEPDIVAPTEPVALPDPVAGAVALEQVSFAYPARPERAALHECSFNVAPGEVVALVGPLGLLTSAARFLAARRLGNRCFRGMLANSLRVTPPRCNALPVSIALHCLEHLRMCLNDCHLLPARARPRTKPA